ncbi:zinc finger protein JACKDAW isoform X1 [Nicotiana tabacum]|uniref:Zinc finger protein JACKDAW isoform X1 n=2 Tax=Nicotiana TaxID=4085 RepID=A0A1S3ZHG7_TOBAC|nr:PREDICTED: zinc finger protein JACKDAW-like isoform X1 [Nicotiana sylvestris]XP_016463819.1 PREDICTED: zinc finger protein JACKDAW-like isoform X1 [Nicotiana tabacum]
MMSGDVFSIPSSVKGVVLPHHPQDVLLEPNPNPKANSSSKKRRNLPGTPDPDAEVIALSPKTLMATNRFLCEICNKGFQRDQNLQLHRRGHNLPWKLKQRNKQEIVKKKVYICPEKTCVHNDPSRALGDLTGIKKHFSRKHGEKKWKCEKCSKKYAVQSDWKAHTKTCGTREYKCDCGTLFSRKDSFITHRAFCDALAEESARITSVGTNNLNFNQQPNLVGGISQIGTGFVQDFSGMTSGNSLHHQQQKPRLSLWLNQVNNNSQLNNPLHMSTPSSNLFASSSSTGLPDHMVQMQSPNNIFGNQMQWAIDKNVAATTPATSMTETLSSMYSDNQNQHPKSSTPMSATALLQKAAQIGSTKSSPTFFTNTFGVMNSSSSSSNTQIFNTLSQTTSEMHQVFAKQSEDYNPTDNGLINGCPNMSSSANTKAINLDQAFMQTVGMQTQAVSFNLDNSLTRDFLGMGNEGGRPFLPQELAKFASMTSAMGLSHYSSGH